MYCLYFTGYISNARCLLGRSVLPALQSCTTSLINNFPSSSKNLNDDKEKICRQEYIIYIPWHPEIETNWGSLLFLYIEGKTMSYISTRIMRVKIMRTTSSMCVMKNYFWNIRRNKDYVDTNMYSQSPLSFGKYILYSSLLKSRWMYLYTLLDAIFKKGNNSVKNSPIKLM